MGQPGAVVCVGAIEAKFTWVSTGGADLEPPKNVVIKVEGQANWVGTSGDCSNGLNDQKVSNPEGGYSLAILQYIKMSGSSFKIVYAPYAWANFQPGETSVLSGSAYCGLRVRRRSMLISQNGRAFVIFLVALGWASSGCEDGRSVAGRARTAQPASVVKKTAPLHDVSVQAKLRGGEALDAAASGNYALAESKFVESLNLEQNPLVRKEFAKFLEARGRKADALNEYVKVINGEGSYVSSIMNSLSFLGHAADLAYEISDPRANELYDKALEAGGTLSDGPSLQISPSASTAQRRAAVRVLRGIELFFGNKPQARTMLLSALEDDPTSCVTHYYLADLAYLMRDNATARAHAALARQYAQAQNRHDVLVALDRLVRDIKE